MKRGMNLYSFPALAKVEERERILTDTDAKVVRFMDVMRVKTPIGVNAQYPRTLDDLLNLDMSGVGSWWGLSGLSLDECINLANRRGVRGWYNIPHTIEMSEVPKVVDYIISRSQLTPIFAYSNEWWNAGEQQYHDLIEMGRAQGINYTDDTRIAFAVYVAGVLKLAELVDGRAEVVAESWLASDYWSEALLSNVADVVDAIAIAPYTNVHMLTLAERIAKHRKLADQFNVKLYAYEIGLDEREDDIEWHRSQGAKDRLDGLLSMAEDGGVELACMYADVTNYESGNVWGVYEVVDGVAVATHKAGALGVRVL